METNQKNDSPESTLLGAIDHLRGEGKWEEIIDLVDKNIDKYRLPREVDGVKRYQCANSFEFLYYVAHHKNEKVEWVKNTEFQLLNRKLFASVELKKFDEAEKLIDELLELSPYDARPRFERFEIAKMQKDLGKCEQLLKEVYPYVWNSQSYAKLIRGYSWLSIEKKDIKSAVNYLALSLVYDDSESSFSYVNNELQYIKNVYKIEEPIERPSFAELKEYFKGHEEFCPTEENVNFGYSLYDYCLKNKDKMQKSDIEYARKNLIMICQNQPYAARIVEVNALTPNKLVTNWEYDFDFQISKKYSASDFDKKAIPSKLYEFRSEKDVINISVGATFDSEEEYQKRIKNTIGNHVQKDNLQIVEESSFVGVNKLKATKVLFKNPEKNTFFVSYWFKLNKNTIGRISARVNENHSALEGDIVGILSTWMAFGRPSDNSTKN